MHLSFGISEKLSAAVLVLIEGLDMRCNVCDLVTMQIPVSELVGGDPFVIGMCGFDIFAHCTVEVCAVDSVYCKICSPGDSSSF